MNKTVLQDKHISIDNSHNRDAASITTSLESSDNTIFRYGSYIIAFFLIGAAFYCRIRLLDVPLERDEGGFAYIGQQLLRGVSPYHSGNMKILPGIHVAYAGIMMLFGETSVGIHTGLLVVNGITIVLLYFLARRMFSMEGAAVAAGSYAILSVSQSVIGVFAHATHFVNLFFLAGLLALLNGVEKNRTIYFFISGLSLGASVLMKQHGVFFCIFALCYIIWNELVNEKQIRRMMQRLIVLMAGLVIPYAATCLYMYLNGVFEEFWFWTVIRSLDYATADYSTETMASLKYYFDKMSMNVLFFWIIALVGLTIVFYPGCRVHKRWFLASLLLFSIIATLPGLSFYPHYFVVMLPSISLLSGIAFETLPLLFGRLIGAGTARMVMLVLFLAMTAFTFYNRFEYLFSLSPYAVSRMIYGTNPFPESREVAKYIKNNSARGTMIAVLGSEPQIYFYANRPSATDYLYMYPLVEQQPHVAIMQQEMIREIEQSAPDYIVSVMITTSWMFDGAAGVPLLKWMENYLPEYYRQVGVVELDDKYGPKYTWDKDAENYWPSTLYYLIVYKRKSA